MRVLSPIKPVRSTFKSKSYSELYKADLESRFISNPREKHMTTV